MGYSANVGLAIWCSESEVFGVVDGLVKQLRDVFVIQGVGHAAAQALPIDQSQMAQHPKLVRDR